MPVRTFEGKEDRGEVPSLAEASIRLPEGVYTTLRTYHGRRVLRLDQHLRRLERSIALKGQAAQVDDATARAVLRHALTTTAHAETRVRLTFAPPRLFVSVEPFVAPPRELYDQGARCQIVRSHREVPQAKDTGFVETAAAEYRQLPVGVQEGLMVGEDFALLEGLSSNFFAVQEGRLRTENERVLEGITRSAVLEVAASICDIDLRAVTLQELSLVGECFITSVSREVMPVVRVDDQAIGTGVPGPTTRRIMRAFADLVEREAEAV